MSDTSPPDLESLLILAATRLPPHHQIVIRVEKDWGGVSLDIDGDLIDYDGNCDESLADQVKRILGELGIDCPPKGEPKP